jgi:hypothetical protein
VEGSLGVVCAEVEGARDKLREYGCCKQQIPPLRCGMTNKGAARCRTKWWLTKKQIPPLRFGMTNKKATNWWQGLPTLGFLFDQGYLFRSVPVFQFFFAVDGVQDVGEVFVVDEAAYVVFGGVGSGPFFSVLLQAEADVVGETYVETAERLARM